MDVKDIKDQESGSTNETAPNGADSAQEQQAKGREVEGPTVGFDPEGYFFVKIHMSHSFLSMLGFLDECKDWLKIRHKGSMVNQLRAEKQNELIKPKGRGRFSLFS